MFINITLSVLCKQKKIEGDILILSNTIKENNFKMISISHEYSEFIIGTMKQSGFHDICYNTVYSYFTITENNKSYYLQIREREKKLYWYLETEKGLLLALTPLSKKNLIEVLQTVKSK